MADRSIASESIAHRSQRARGRRSAPLWWTLAAAIAIVGGGFIAWHLSRGAPVPIRTAVAISLKKQSASQDAPLSWTPPATSLRGAAPPSHPRSPARSSGFRWKKASWSRAAYHRPSRRFQRPSRLAQSEAQVKQAEAICQLQQTAYEDAHTNFRALRAKAAAVISAQSFDEANTQFDSAGSEFCGSTCA